MNYRHAYHAGNFADVVKHIVLSRIIEYLKRKDAPFRVIDTHAGIGLYDLSSSRQQGPANGSAASAGLQARPLRPKSRRCLVRISTLPG